ncbi:ABC transporter permease [Candidatus Woesearchaeota archaeon]|nr:ABC transporter permease [Candidatus Woesearchaeota archaeon]
MDLREIVRLAASNLRRRRLRALLTVIGIIFGITSIVSLVSLAQGLQDSIGGQFGRLGTNDVIITQKGLQGPPIGTKALTTKDVDFVEKFDELAFVVPTNIQPAGVKVGHEEADLLVRVIPAEMYDEWGQLRDWQFVAGRNIQPTSRGEVVIGQKVAEEVFKKEILVNTKIKINDQEFKVVGIVKNTGSRPDDQLVGIVREDGEDLFKFSNAVNVILARVKKGVNIDVVVARMQRRINKFRGAEDIEVQTAAQVQELFKNIIGIVSIVVIGIAAISLVVGGIGIANSMFTSVLERTKEIGVMKSIGARNADILSLFLVEAGMIGLIGGAGGMLIGVLIALGVQVGGHAAGIDITVSIKIWVLLGAMLFSMTIGIIAGLIPAIRASKQDPVESLRYE